jgi:hypothetical protein
MHVITAVTAGAELATQHPTVVEKILLFITILVLLGMVSRAWNVMLMGHHGKRRWARTKPPARKKK